MISTEIQIGDVLYVDHGHMGWKTYAPVTKKFLRECSEYEDELLDHMAEFESQNQDLADTIQTWQTQHARDRGEIDALTAEREGTNEILRRQAAAIGRRDARIRRLEEVRAWYGDAETYIAIGFLPDPPCGEFMDDFSETEYGWKPGKRAREALNE